MTLAELIARYAPAAANTGNWASVAATLNARTVQKTSAGTLTSLAKTLAALQASEREPTLRAFATTEVGKDGRVKLATEGLDFAHPITVGLIEDLRNALPVGVADKLLRLGVWTEPVVASIGLQTVTADQCQAAWTQAESEQAAQLLLARRGVLESALRQLPIDTVVGSSGLPTQKQVTDRIIEHLTTFGVTFGA